ncbi:MAG: efflux RND transporter periplasmic adaptor subunit [Mangrovicoccus sp.]
MITGNWMRRGVFIVVAALVLIAVVLIMWDTEDTADVSERQVAPPAPIVSIVEVNAKTARAQVSTFAELRPRWNAQIRAAVGGRITEVHNAALAGTRIEAGTVLFSIERAAYEADVAEAELQLEQAKLTNLQAQNQVTVARRQFVRDGTEPPTELALFLPQQRIAERSVTSAEAQLRSAQRQLADTEVSAPFAGFVTQRMVSLGQTVTVGDPLLHLADDRQFEMVVELSQADWALLDHPISGATVQLFHRDGRLLGEARIRQGGGFLDPATHQMRVFIEVSDPSDGILSGDFLRVAFKGRAIQNTLTLPETALTRSGHIWFIGDDDVLQRTQPEILFRSGPTLTIAAPEGGGPWKVSVAPLSSFLPGQRVTPQPAEG